MIEKTIERADAALRFHTTATDRFKMSRLSFNFILPADAEMSPRVRLMLATMMRGCEKYPTVVDINKRLDELYGATVTWRATTVGERHVFRISCEILGDRYRFADDKESIVKGVCEVILEILFAPLKDSEGLLSESNFESEKKIAIDAVRAKINDQKAYAADKCKSLMFKGEKAGISIEGSVQTIEQITLREISDAHDHFLKNSIVECYYVGNDDISEVVELVSSRFAKIGRDAVMLSGEEKALARDDGEPLRTLEETMNVSQSRLNIGCICGVVMQDSEYYAMSLFNEIFGGSSVAKLFMNVREKQSLCYYCYSSYGSATGTIMIGCGIKRENRKKAYAEIEKQLSEMQAGRFSEEEISTAKKTVISGILQISDSPSAIEAFNFRRYLADVCETPEDVTEKIKRVTKDEIIAAAKKVRFDTVYFLCGNGEEEEEYDE